MSLPKISPAEARRLLDRGAILVDIREADERAREQIAGARHLPLSGWRRSTSHYTKAGPSFFTARVALARRDMPPGSP